MQSVRKLCWVLVILLVWPICLEAAGSIERTRKNILIINSYHKGLKWTDDIMAGFTSVFPLESPDYSVRVEYMDTKRIVERSYINNLLEVYRDKYSEYPVDLILTSDDSAYNLLLNHGRELFGDTPAVFCGVNYFDPSDLDGRTGITGVVEGYDIHATIDVARKLHPEIRTVYYLNDRTLTGKAIYKEFENVMREFQDTLEFRELVGRDVDELALSAQALPTDSLLLMLIYFRDEEGNSYSHSDVVERLAATSSVPIYGVWDFHLGHGIVGGRLTRGYFQGKTAAEFGLRILQGEPVRDIPVVTENTTQFAFDDTKLKQYGIPFDRLPHDSEIINYSGRNRKQILVLNSYHKGMQWEDDIDAGLREVLASNGVDVEIFYDFMDIKRNPDPAFIQTTYYSLITKYSNRRFDAILAVDDPAFHFISQYHDTVFPDTPVVFCGVNYFDETLAKDDDAPWFTGVVEAYDLQGTIDVALQIQPKLEKVIVVNDTTLTGKANRQNIEKLVDDNLGKLHFELWEELSMPEIRARAKELDKHTMLLLLNFYRDGSNNVYSYKETIQLISSVSRVPIYSVWDFYMDSGILGGLLTSGRNQGHIAGEMIGNIIEGTPVSEIPLVTESPNLYMFDQEVMDRYAISSDDLPPGSTIINQPFSFVAYYRANPGIVNAFLIMLLLMVVMILLILLQRNTLRVRKEFEKELQEARNVAELASIAKGRFLANMSHEIRTPMNGLIGMTDLAMEKAQDPVQKDYLEIVKRSGQSLLRVINDILDYSKIEAGKMELSEETLDLHKLLNDVSQLFTTSASQKGLLLKLTIGDEVPEYVVGDSIRLRQVLCNLVGNAIKFTDKGQVTLEVSCRPVDGVRVSLQCRVKDTGPGIAEDMQGNLFEDFKQLGGSSVQPGAGTGLGLSISRHLVELMGGEIRLHSIPGEGSVFSFEIPVVRSSGKDVAANEASDQVLEYDRHGHILVAEDDEISLSLMQLVLEKEGYEVTSVVNGSKVLSVLEQEEIDLVVLDINMPGMSGLEVASAIRSSEMPGKRIPIVAMSANAMQQDKERGYAAGMDAYLTKPIQVDEVNETLDRLLAARDDVASPVGLN